jgi:hypothetical protein
MTLGNAAAAKVRLIVWCKACGHQVEPDPGEHARRYGAETTVSDWKQRLACSGKLAFLARVRGNFPPGRVQFFATRPYGAGSSPYRPTTVTRSSPAPGPGHAHAREQFRDRDCR